MRTSLDRRRRSKSRRIGRLAVGLLAGGAVLLAGTPAQAAVTWPAAGHVPTCDTVVREASDWSYVDRTPPTIRTFKATRYVALTSLPRTFTLGTARVTDTCSGVSGMEMFFVFSGTLTTGVLFAPTNHWFDATMSLKSSLDLSRLGAMKWQSLLAIDRYSDFKLSLDHKSLLSDNPRGGAPEDYATQELPASTVTYLVRKTYAAVPTRSVAKVRAGSNVTLKSAFTVATPTSHAHLSGVPVKLQRRYSGGVWKTMLGSATTTAGGNAYFHIHPTKTASYRFVYAGRFAAPWNAPVTSGTVKVSVT